MPTGAILAIIIIRLLLLLAGLVWILIYSYAVRVAYKFFARPQPRPVYDKSPLSIKQDTIFGRGQNWFYSNRMNILDWQMTAFDGIKLYAVSGYRSYNTQKSIYNKRLEETSLEYVSRYIAKPGESEHQTGLAMDLLDRDSRNLTESFADTAAYAWLSYRAWEFGFILRYTEEGEKETGYAFEPWHVRYVGDAAEEIWSSGLTYEAWLARRKSYAYSRGREPLIAR